MFAVTSVNIAISKADLFYHSDVPLDILDIIFLLRDNNRNLFENPIQT